MNKGMMKIYYGFLLTLCVGQALAQHIQINSSMADLFDRANVKGTLVVYDSETSTAMVHNATRATERYVPASTFKIANSLIGLSVGAVKDVDEIIPYGGTPQPIKAWERDMSLKEAIPISNVPVYQELARRIGLERMQSNVSLLDYGNGQIGSSVDTFWLEGPLKISALEQSLFLARLARGQLPMTEKVQADVREMIHIDQGDDWKLYGKTGWSKEIGWWVGWVEKEGRVYSFALNMDMPDVKDAPKRVELGRGCLTALGLLD